MYLSDKEISLGGGSFALFSWEKSPACAEQDPIGLLTNNEFYLCQILHLDL